MFEVSVDVLHRNLHGTTPVNFSYMKKDGTMRDAIGTLHMDLIPEDLRPKDSSTNFVGENLKYFDLEKNDWRSLPINCSLIQMIE